MSKQRKKYLEQHLAQSVSYQMALTICPSTFSDRCLKREVCIHSSSLLMQSCATWLPPTTHRQGSRGCHRSRPYFELSAVSPSRSSLGFPRKVLLLSSHLCHYFYPNCASPRDWSLALYMLNVVFISCPLSPHFQFPVGRFDVGAVL